jgi:preprotein translocase subunit SecY
MLSWITNAWRVPELRRRVLFTAMILAFYRLGSWIPAPGVDPDKIKATFKNGVLEVHVPKSAQAAGKAIEVKAA